jgi:hypothetical protein
LLYSFVPTFTSASSTAAQNVTGATLTLAVGIYVVEIEAAYEATGTIASTETFGLSGVTASSVSLTGHVMQLSATATDNLSTLATATSLANAMYTSPTKGGTAEYGVLWIRGKITVSVAGTLQLVMTNTTAADEATLSGILMKAFPVSS